MPYISLEDQGFYRPFDTLRQGLNDFYEGRRQRRMDAEDQKDRELRRSYLQSQMSNIQAETSRRNAEGSFVPRSHTVGDRTYVETAPNHWEEQKVKPPSVLDLFKNQVQAPTAPSAQSGAGVTGNATDFGTDLGTTNTEKPYASPAGTADGQFAENTGSQPTQTAPKQLPNIIDMGNGLRFGLAPNEHGELGLARLPEPKPAKGFELKMIKDPSGGPDRLFATHTEDGKVTSASPLDTQKSSEKKDLETPFFGPDARAKSIESAKNVRQAASDLSAAVNNIDELIKIAKERPGIGKSFDFNLRARTKALQQATVGLLRLPLTGPGALNEGERSMLEKMISNPTDVFSLDSSNITSLEELKRILYNKMQRTAESELEGSTWKPPLQVYGDAKPVNVTSQADYDALPAGSKFIDSSGQVKTKGR